MNEFSEKLRRLETIPEKDVKNICEKVLISLKKGEGNFDGRTKYGSC